jgi:spore coat protein U-like protein
MNLKRLQLALIACGLMAATGTALAAEATTTFNVTGTVIGVCTVSVPAMAFGTTIPATIASNIDTSVNMSVTCASSVGYGVALSAGGGTGATYAVRRLTSGTDTMDYSLYRDSGRTEVWGDGSGTTVAYSGTGTGAAQTIPVYGRIPPQTVPTGAYTDTITVTLTY